MSLKDRVYRLERRSGDNLPEVRSFINDPKNGALIERDTGKECTEAEVLAWAEEAENRIVIFWGIVDPEDV